MEPTKRMRCHKYNIILITFLNYENATLIRFRYPENAWFDFHRGISRENFKLRLRCVPWPWLERNTEAIL